jgi:hypothetical protein
MNADEAQRTCAKADHTSLSFKFCQGKTSLTEQAIRQTNSVATGNAVLGAACSGLLASYALENLAAAQIVQRLIEHRVALPFHAASAEGAPPFQRQIVQLAATLQAKAALAPSASALAQLVAALAAATIEVLLLKGLAYAQAFYPTPAARRSTDHDILVAPDTRLRAHAVLLTLGYHALSADVFQSICGQASYRSSAGVTIDLHWELGNNFALFGRFEFTQMRADAVALSVADTRCWRPSDVLCALHSALSYICDAPAQRSYLALLDYLLITRSFSAHQHAQLHALARASSTHGVLSAVHRELEAVFGMPRSAQESVFPASPQESVFPASPQESVFPASPQESVFPASPQESVFPASPQESVFPASPQESATQFADPADALLAALTRRYNGRLWWPLTTPRPLAAKLHFLARQLFPPARYMRARSGDATSALITLHARRFAKALRMLF